MLNHPVLQRIKSSTLVLPARNESYYLLLRSLAYNLKVTKDLHAEVREGHRMVFDPNIRQNASIRIAHQLQLVRISPCHDPVSGLKEAYLLTQIVDTVICFFVNFVLGLDHHVKPYQDDNAVSAGYPPMGPPCPDSSLRKTLAAAYSGSAADAMPPRKPCSRRQSLVPA